MFVASAGRCLQRISSPLKGKVNKLITDFFDWRYDVGDAEELEDFLSWLEASHLDSAWKLEACSKVLDIYKMKSEVAYIWTSMLHRVLPNNTERVVECFAKIVKDSDINNLYINKQEAVDILVAGIKSRDKDIKQLAKQVKQRLFDGGWEILLKEDMNDRQSKGSERPECMKRARKQAIQRALRSLKAQLLSKSCENCRKRTTTSKHATKLPTSAIPCTDIWKIKVSQVWSLHHP